MTNVWNHAVMPTLPIKMGEQQENACQPFLAGIAALMYRKQSNLKTCVVATVVGSV
jgi:hypothetical protein